MKNGEKKQNKTKRLHRNNDRIRIECIHMIVKIVPCEAIHFVISKPFTVKNVLDHNISNLKF